jgi:hypothetical protein
MHSDTALDMIPAGTIVRYPGAGNSRVEARLEDGTQGRLLVATPVLISPQLIPDAPAIPEAAVAAPTDPLERAIAIGVWLVVANVLAALVWMVGNAVTVWRALL